MDHHDRLSMPARCFATLVAAVSLAALVLQYVLLIRSTLDTVGPATATVKFFSYFTILGNLLVTGVCGAAAFGSDGRWERVFARPGMRGAAALYIGVTGITYTTILRHLWQPQGAQWWADTGLHYATPLLYLAWWLVAIGHGRLQWRDLARWLLFPLAYVAWTYLRGRWTGEYPYPFLDLGALGVASVLRNAGAMLLLFVAVGLVLVALDRGLGRRRARRSMGMARP